MGTTKVFSDSDAGGRPSICMASSGPDLGGATGGIFTTKRHVGQLGPEALNHCRKQDAWNRWPHGGTRRGSPSAKAARQMPHSSGDSSGVVVLLLPPLRL